MCASIKQTYIEKGVNSIQLPLETCIKPLTRTSDHRPRCAFHHNINNTAVAATGTGAAVAARIT